MAIFRFKGLEEYEVRLAKIGSLKFSQESASAVIYEGASIIADAIRAEIAKLEVIDYTHRGTEENKINGVTAAQKEGLLDGLGITPLEEKNGFYNRKIGFDGYNRQKTKKYPQGQPNSMIARSVNSGTSFREKNPFVDETARKKKPEVEKAMAEAFDRILKKKMEE